jgi:peptidoglycan/xylan/chitin deacetylase (PgdA/CDA1 family)
VTTTPASTIVDTVPGEGPVVGYTFDDGPNPVDTPHLLGVLRSYGVRAVFFLIGEQARRHPDLVRRIVADGHLLGNHSMNHDDLGDWDADRIRADLRAADGAIRAAVPDARIPFFRAPYGSWGVSPGVAAGLGMRSVGWRLDIEDWHPPGADTLVERLRRGVAPGAVVLLHDGGGDRSQTVEAVRRTVPTLRAEGYRFVQPAV